MSGRRPRTILALALLIAPGRAAGGLAPGEVSDPGHEGVLLRSGAEAVLIDALYGDGLRGYPVVPAETRGALERAEPPYDQVDLVLATHEHPDHFDPEAVLRFLGANRSARFVSTPQAVARLRALAPPEPVAARLDAVLPGRLESVPLEAPIGLGVVELHHGAGTDAQNLGFVVTLGGVRVLHVGDTEIDAEEARALALPAVDLALLPSWVLGDPALVRALNGRRLAAMHLPVTDAPAAWFGRHRTLERLGAHLRALHPGLHVFTTAGDMLEVAPGAKPERRPPDPAASGRASPHADRPAG